MAVQSINPPHNPLDGQRPELTIPLHDGTAENISIIIVHKDRPEYLNILLQSIVVNSYNSNYELIVVDNGSSEDSQTFLNEIEESRQVKVVRNSTNEYWSAACNKGVQKADKNSKYFIFLHADIVILNPAWMDLLINVADSKKSGFVGVQTHKYKMGTNDAEFIQEHVLLITRECFKDIGPWPEELPLIGHAFVMTLKALTKGYNPQVMKNPITHHYKIFGIDVNEHEKILEKAIAILPKMISDVNSRAVK